MTHFAESVLLVITIRRRNIPRFSRFALSGANLENQGFIL